MTETLALRRHLYGLLRQRPFRERRALRRQISLLAAVGGGDPDGGAAGVREPRRPRPPTSPGSPASSSTQER